MKRNILFIFLLLCPYILQAQVELHPKYSSPNMGNGAKLSNDGSKVVTWNRCLFSVWDVQSGKMIYTVSAHHGEINNLEFNNSGTAIVTASSDKTAKIWNAQNGELIHTLNAHIDRVYYAEFNATDDRIISKSQDGNILLWNAKNGRIIANLVGKDGHNVTNSSFNKQGDKIIIYNNCGMLKIYDALSGLALYEYETKTECIRSARFVVDGEKIYINKNDSLFLLTINKDFEKIVVKGEPDTTVKHRIRTCSTNCCSPYYYNNDNIDICTNGKYMVRLIRDKVIVVQGVQYGETVFIEEDTVHGHKFAEFNKSGTLLLIIRGNGVATVRNTSSWEKVLSVGEKNAGIVSIHSDYLGNTIVAVDVNGIITICDGKTGSLLRELKQNIPIKDEDFDNVKNCIPKRVENGTVAVISPLTGNRLVEFNTQNNLPKWIRHYPKVSRFVLNYDSIVEIRNSVTGACVTSFKKTDNCYSDAGFSAAGDVLLTITENGYELRSAFTGKLIQTITIKNTAYIFTTYNFTERYITANGPNNTLTMIDIKNENEKIVLQGHIRHIYSANFDKSGKYIVTGSEDGTARVWDMKTRKTIIELKGHKGAVWASFDNGGKRIITSSTDSTAKIWNAFTGELIAILTEHKGSVNDAFFSKDNQTIITKSSDGIVRVYDANELPYSFTDIEEDEVQITMTLSPNPAQNEIQITFTEPLKEKGEYSIVSPTGMQITKGTIEALSSGFTYRIDKTISNGTYICIIRTGEKSFEEKFVVIR